MYAVMHGCRVVDEGDGPLCDLRTRLEVGAVYAFDDVLWFTAFITLFMSLTLEIEVYRLVA